MQRPAWLISGYELYKMPNMRKICIIAKNSKVHFHLCCILSVKYWCIDATYFIFYIVYAFFSFFSFYEEIIITFDRNYVTHLSLHLEERVACTQKNVLLNQQKFCWINKDFHWPIFKRKTLLGQPNFCWFNKNLVGLTKFFV